MAEPLDSLKATLLAASSAADGDPEDVRTWPTWNPLQPHVAVLVDHADKHRIAEPTSVLMSQLGTLLYFKAQHAEAEPLMRRALAIFGASLVKGHPDTITVQESYRHLLTAMNLSEDEISERLRPFRTRAFS